MACDTIGQLCKHDRIVCEARAVTVQAPAHVHLVRDGIRHRADLAVALFAMQAGSDMGAVAEVNEIRQDGDRHPGDRFALFHIGDQLIYF